MSIGERLKSRPPLPGGPYLVVGLARSGRAVASALRGRGETVFGCDRGEPADSAGLEAIGVEVHLDAEGLELLADTKALVKSPGVPPEAPVVARARELGIPVLGELELAWRLIPNRFVAVTGTNGKTTTTSLIGKMFEDAGLPVVVAGNIGRPLSEVALAPPSSQATVVCEASSFQLEDTVAFSPECAVFLNFRSDHLDRHHGLTNYLAAKRRIFENQSDDDIAVLNGDDRAMPDELNAKVVRFCSAARKYRSGRCDITLDDGEVRVGGDRLFSVDEMTMLGSHNVENAMAAAAVGLEFGIDRSSIAGTATRFGGVEHRLEVVNRIRDVLYVNDSKATNVEATRTALMAFDVPVNLILGGSDKGEDFEPLAAELSARPVMCFLYGEAAGRIAGSLKPAGVEFEHHVRFEHAFSAASGLARPGEVVLLSPACASFDQFVDFEARGREFNRLVRGLR